MVIIWQNHSNKLFCIIWQEMHKRRVGFCCVASGLSCKRGTLLCPLLSSALSTPPPLPFTGSARPPGPWGEMCGEALLSCHWTWRDYADSCWWEEGRFWPSPDVNLNTSLRSVPRFWGLMGKNIRNSKEIWSQNCCVNVHVKVQIEEQSGCKNHLRETKFI